MIAIVAVGESPSVTVKETGHISFPATSEIVDLQPLDPLTVGVYPVPIAEFNVRVTTPGEVSAAAITSLLP